jgi:hypothetical protein
VFSLDRNQESDSTILASFYCKLNFSFIYNTSKFHDKNYVNTKALESILESTYTLVAYRKKK